ncbi:MAG: pilus assembly protein TadG-related protein [Herpetosiphon sp.]
MLAHVIQMCARLHILRDRRGSVALMVGIMAPVLLTVMALAIEVTSWSVGTLELQRIADASAWAGALQYVATQNAHSAAGAAADVAEINGIVNATSRTWNSSTLTINDNMVTAQIVSGIRDPQGVAVKVSVKRSVPKTLSLIASTTTTTVTLSATATAEVGSTGPQPCILGLGNGVDGITTGNDLTVSGNASLVANGCSVRADDGISENGSATINASGVYAGGTISGSGICCDLHANAGQIPDPYATNAPVQNALNSLSSGAGTAISVKPNASQSIGPGTYSGWNVSGTLTLSPGLYVVNGDITAGAQAKISGSGVTIVTSGTVSSTGGSTLALSAPSTSPTAGGLPGILLAGRANTTMAFLGNSTAPVTGVLYFPNANLKFAGTSSSGSSGCTEVIAATVTLVGTSNLGANCSQYGALSFGSKPSSITLVQ